jgi:hypothetical protein
VLHTALRCRADASRGRRRRRGAAGARGAGQGLRLRRPRCAAASGPASPGSAIETVVNIGIGGSDLGPVMVYEALQPYVQAGLSCRFVSNIDPTDVREKTADLDPETYACQCGSMTFTTLETLTNARLAPRLAAGRVCAASGAIEDGTSGRRRRWPSTSSPCPPRWTRGRVPASTRRNCVRFLGLGGRPSTRWTRPSATSGGRCGDRAGELRGTSGRLPLIDRHFAEDRAGPQRAGP